jgi:hypothetical protein
VLLIASRLHSRSARQNPRSKLRQWLLHTSFSDPLVEQYEASILLAHQTNKWMDFKFWCARLINPIISMSLGPAACVLIFIIACIWYCCYQLYVYQPQVLFTFGEGLAWPRAIGNLCCMPLTFIFFPVTKHSVLLHLVSPHASSPLLSSSLTMQLSVMSIAWFTI